MQRFWDKVEKGSHCWLYTGGALDKDGYGVFSFSHTKQIRAHRYSWTLKNGAIPKGKCVCHTCDNPPCVNPDHLFLDTNAGNTMDRLHKGRSAMGEGHGMAKITEVDVRKIRDDWRSCRIIGEEYGLSPSGVHLIRRRHKWKHVT